MHVLGIDGDRKEISYILSDVPGFSWEDEPCVHEPNCPWPTALLVGRESQQEGRCSESVGRNEQGAWNGRV